MIDKLKNTGPTLVVDARLRQWLGENGAAFKEQAHWHEQHDHPLADILMDPETFS